MTFDGDTAPGNFVFAGLLISHEIVFGTILFIDTTLTQSSLSSIASFSLRRVAIHSTVLSLKTFDLAGSDAKNEFRVLQISNNQHD